MINDATIQLIKQFEGLELKAYRDTGGVWTIGYGTTAAADVGIDPGPGDVITERQAELYLHRAVDKFAANLAKLIKGPVTDNQFGAMVSLAYNIGPGAFQRSTLLRMFNAGDVAGAADQFARWNKDDGKVLNGLVRRRAAERALFLRAGSDKSVITSSKPSPPQAQGGWIVRLLAAIFGRGNR